MTVAEILDSRDLARRLSEAEATIEALLSGQIDAVIDPTSQTPVLVAKAQEALRQSEERYRRIIETTNEGVWLLDSEHKTTFMNGRMAQMLGCEAGMGVGRSPLEFLDVAGRARFAARRQLKKGDVEQLEVQYIRLDGKTVWTLVDTAPVFDSAGRYDGSLAMVMDITDRKLAEAALRASEARFRRLWESGIILITISDLTGKISEINDAGLRMLGYSHEELISGHMGWDDFTVPESQGGEGTARAQLAATGVASPGEKELIRKDGTHVSVLAAAAILDGVERIAIAVDLTDRKRAEKLQSQLMVSDRMASVGTLAAGVAHEINNPLAAVIANLDYIEESLGSRSAGGLTPGSGLRDAGFLEEIREPLDDARSAARRVRVIVRDLKIFSRSPDETSGPVDVKATMESSLGMAWNEIRHRARLVKRYGRVPGVEANEARLGQVFLNLVVNAAQSLQEGQAERNEICVSTRLEAERVIIEVGDTGSGISPEIIGRIFDPFFTTKPIGVGTGLGLAICQRIVTDMGGELTVTSVLGKGTTFRVALPVALTAAHAVAPPVEGVSAVGRRGRILVVDDEKLVASVVQRILSKEHEVVSMVSAKEALALIAGGTTFDLILCDLMMPDMTGMDLHGELSQAAPEQADRMIFLTGGAFTPKARHFLSDSPKEFIEKPFDAANLRAIVRRYLR